MSIFPRIELIVGRLLPHSPKSIKNEQPGTFCLKETSNLVLLRRINGQDSDKEMVIK